MYPENNAPQPLNSPTPQPTDEQRRLARVAELRKRITVLIVVGIIINFVVAAFRFLFDMIGIPVEVIMSIVAFIFVGLIANPVRELNALTTTTNDSTPKP